MSQIDEINDRLYVVEVISAYVPLKKAGRNYKGLCPFHAEKTPSFVVFPETGTWHCFGACNTGGDIFSFIMKKENLDFGEALRLLAQKAGVVLEERQPASAEEQTHLARLYELHSVASTYYHHLLQTSSRAQIARDYIARRGLNQETVDNFELGYAPDEWDALLRYLTSKGYALADILEAGLIVEREDGSGHYDRFRGRLMIPIRDRRGRVIGFGARALDDSVPKYLNSPQTPLFDKSRILFGLDRAAHSIRNRGEVVIVEGYMDVLATHQYGADYVVASMGTALTETQLAQLSRLATRFVLALDPDLAGDQATLRGLHLARQTLGRRKVPTLNARGAVQHEERLLVDLRILSLPAGKDPDEVIREDPAGWETLLAKAQPLVEYYMNQVTKGLDLNDARGKSQAVQQMKPILLELADEIERRHYIQQLARRVRLDEAVIEREIMGERAAALSRRPTRGESRRRAAALESALADYTTPTPARRTDFGIEEQCLLYLIRHPSLIHQLSFAFGEADVPFLTAEDFGRSENRAIFACILANAEAGQLQSAEELTSALGEPLGGYIQQLLAQTAEGPAVSEEELSDDLARCALRLKGRSLRQAVDRLYYLLQEPAEGLEAEQAEAYAELARNYMASISQIDRTLHARTMVGRRQTLEAEEH